MSESGRLSKKGAYEKQSEGVLASLRELAKSYNTYNNISLKEVRNISSKVPIPATETVRELTKTD